MFDQARKANEFLSDENFVDNHIQFFIILQSLIPATNFFSLIGKADGSYFLSAGILQNCLTAGIFNMPAYLKSVEFLVNFLGKSFHLHGVTYLHQRHKIAGRPIDHHCCGKIHDKWKQHHWHGAHHMLDNVAVVCV